MKIHNKIFKNNFIFPMMLLMLLIGVSFAFSYHLVAQTGQSDQVDNPDQEEVENPETEPENPADEKTDEQKAETPKPGEETTEPKDEPQDEDSDTEGDQDENPSEDKPSEDQKGEGVGRIEGKDPGDLPPGKWTNAHIVYKLEHFTSPIEGAHITKAESHLPGAPRPYRNGTHEGVDYFNGFVGVPIEVGTPILSVAEGKVIRADHDYEELDPEYWQALLDEAHELQDTPPDTLDKLRGKQVWVEHDHGIVARYAHLETIEPHIKEGYQVEKGELIATVGNSGTGSGVRGTNEHPHLHFEIWLDDDRFLGQNKGAQQSHQILTQILVEQ